MSVRDYEGNGIVVHWDAARCEHSGRCVAGAPAVFDPRSRPWITAGACSADDLAAVIDTCPSGALSYTRTDGGAHGRRGHAEGEDPAAARRADLATTETAAPATESAPTITPRQNGPLVVEGPVTLIDAAGVAETHERLFLCRCGASNTKPRCDGSHKRVGFAADGVAPPPRPAS